MQRSTTVQTRGRVTLPLSIRRVLNVAAGDDVVFVQTAPGRFEVRAEARRAVLLDRVRGVARDSSAPKPAPRTSAPPQVATAVDSQLASV